jgi:hypothetical protein
MSSGSLFSPLEGRWFGTFHFSLAGAVDEGLLLGFAEAFFDGGDSGFVALEVVGGLLAQAGEKGLELVLAEGKGGHLGAGLLAGVRGAAAELFSVRAEGLAQGQGAGVRGLGLGFRGRGWGLGLLGLAAQAQEAQEAEGYFPVLTHRVCPSAASELSALIPGFRKFIAQALLSSFREEDQYQPQTCAFGLVCQGHPRFGQILANTRANKWRCLLRPF